ncbi:hypothetical protein V5N11_027563 [Cardamine amara subsp. amara]|uniref:SWIM-type domain-containing protein n=1 Tax=Cardamine amara subsp. amara TaxID=228776 RepID=A0ABD1AB94_CARAN
MIVELEKVEALAKEAQGFPSTSKGKQKMVQINNDAQTPSSNNGCEPYATAEEVEYNYDYWNALITKEYGIGVDVQSLDVGETSNYVRPPTDAQEERQNFNIETVVQESSGHDDGQHTKSHDHLAIQSSLANIYNDILEGDSLSAPDCEPCFGDQLLQSEDMESRVFDPANDAIYIGRVFRNKVDMQTAVAIYAIKRVFNYKQVKSDKERVIMKCVDDNCHWRVYGHVVTQGSENIQIRTARLTHTCSVQTRSQFSQNATSKVVAQVLRSKYTNGKPGPRAVDIPAIVLDEMHVSISYMKGWHAKEKAITQARGTEEGSYNLLMRYLEVLKATNEGTLTDVVCTKSGEAKDKFKYLFFALGACIKSVDCMRKVLIVDATAIKAKFKGTLITASFQDGNFQIMPVAFGVVDRENDRSWSWFFCRLATIVPDAEDLVIVSDRHNSIYSAIRGVYSLAKHGACAVHLTRNVKARFRKQKGLTLLVSQAAFAYTVAEFQKKFKEIEARSPLCATYLKGIGISHWTRAYFQGKRYNIMSSNVAECLNAALANALELPIVTMVDAIRMMIMRWFYERRTKSYNHAGTVTPEVEKMLVKNLADSAGLSVFPATNSIFQINSGEGDPFSVDLERGSCTCRVFDTLGIPCRHAMAAARVSGIPVHAMVDDLYKTKNWQNAYSNVVMPVPNAAETDATNSNENYDMLPPVSKQPAGRPRKRRIPSAGENMPSKIRGKRTCSRCGGEGHNRATCTYGIP